VSSAVELAFQTVRLASGCRNRSATATSQACRSPPITGSTRPNLNWADRALLAALLGVIPKARRHGLRLLVTPDMIVRWHRGIVRRRWAARSRRGKTGRPVTRRNTRPGSSGWPGRIRMGLSQDPGELAGLGVRVSAATVWEILKEARIGLSRSKTGFGR
jgi:putative transposase